MLIRDMIDYPNLTHWVRRELPKIPNKTKVWKAFKKFGQLNNFTAIKVLNWNDFSPLLRIKVLGNDNGQFNSNKPDTVILAKEIATRFEKDFAKPEAVLLLESTILHELVHWGDHRDGIDQSWEEGAEFEKEAYGENIGRYWSGNISSKFNLHEHDLDNIDQSWPRGIRNNNPGNIRIGENWQGLATKEEMKEFQRSEKEFCVFNNAIWGIRAIVVILNTYQRKGFDTVEKMIGRWAPHNDKNPTQKYVEFVAEHMEIEPDEKFNIQDKNLAQKMVEAIIAFENNNRQPYDDKLIWKGFELSGNYQTA